MIKVLEYVTVHSLYVTVTGISQLRKQVIFFIRIHVDVIDTREENLLQNFISFSDGPEKGPETKQK